MIESVVGDLAPMFDACRHRIAKVKAD